MTENLADLERLLEHVPLTSQWVRLDGAVPAFGIEVLLSHEGHEHVFLWDGSNVPSAIHAALEAFPGAVVDTARRVVKGECYE